MAAAPPPHDPEDSPQDESGKMGIKSVIAAALFGGSVAAAGAYFGTRALARKNREKDGRPLNSVMATAITACDLAHEKPASDAAKPAPRKRRAPAKPKPKA